MSKRLTLTNRWREWAKIDPFFAYTALGTMMASFLSLGVHLCFFLGGTVTGIALISMIVFAVITEIIFIVRKQGWWAWFWAWIIVSVGVWELASYFWGCPVL